MASQQDPRMKEDVRGKEIRAEEAARTAADELRDVSKQRAVTGAPGEVVVEHREERQSPNENRTGIIGSILQTVTGTLGGAKDAVTGKTHEATEKAGEYKDYTAQKAGEAADKTGEYKDYTSQKTRETADVAAQKTKEAKDTTMGKIGEYKDYTLEKTKEAADATAQKAKGAKDYTADKAKETKDYTAEKAKEAKDYTADKANEAKEKMGEFKDYTADKAKEAKDYTADKSREGKDSAVGKLSELKDKAMDFFTGKKEETKEKMNESGDFAKGASYETEEDARRKLETMHLKDQGYEAKGTKLDYDSGRSGEDVVATVAEVDPVRETAETFRKSDQMSGQSFNDVGGMNDDDGAKGTHGGVYRVQLKHEKK